MDRDVIVGGCGKKRFMQRAVAANEFYGYSKIHFDYVLVAKASIESTEKR